MPTVRQLLRSFALTALLAASPVLATATATPVELGSDGTIYRLWSGTFGELFGPANTAVPAEVPVLALDIIAPGQALVRHLVPGTESPATETTAALLFDRSSASVHVVWNARTVANFTVSRLQLRTLAASGWSELIELSGGSLTDKSALRLAITSDDYAEKVDGVSSRVARRVLHLVWVESVGEIAHAYYSPVVFVRGDYLGWNPVVALDDLATPEDPMAAASPAAAALLAAPTLVATPTGKVTASFIQSQTHQLVAVDVQMLPAELGELAEMARGHIVELAQTIGLDDRNQLATLARGHIVELAAKFHPAAAKYLGDRTGELLLSADASADGAVLAEMARGHIVELGREILANGLANRCAAEELLLEIPALAPASAESTFSHLFVMRQVARWEVPSDLVAADARILVSADGMRATIAWSAEGHLYYREVDAGGAWSPARDLDLAHISLTDAW
ncbi:MAG: hypothetical protein ABIV06_12895, partial [Thermoanaerobaculia bacterium]